MRKIKNDLTQIRKIFGKSKISPGLLGAKYFEEADISDTVNNIMRTKGITIFKNNTNIQIKSNTKNVLL